MKEQFAAQEEYNHHLEQIMQISDRKFRIQEMKKLNRSFRFKADLRHDTLSLFRSISVYVVGLFGGIVLAMILSYLGIWVIRAHVVNNKQFQDASSYIARKSEEIADGSAKFDPTIESNTAGLVGTISSEQFPLK